MAKLKLTLLAAAVVGAASIGSASAMPFDNLATVSVEPLVQNARVVCNQNGRRCYNTRSSVRSYEYAPSYYVPNQYNEYYGGPAYGYYGEPGYGYARGPGYYGYGSPGVSIGIGGFGIRVR